MLVFFPGEFSIHRLQQTIHVDRLVGVDDLLNRGQGIRRIGQTDDRDPGGIIDGAAFGDVQALVQRPLEQGGQRRRRGVSLVG